MCNVTEAAHSHGTLLMSAPCVQMMPRGEEGLLEPKLATHLVCGQLSGVAGHADHLMRSLSDACSEVRHACVPKILKMGP